MYLSYLYMLKCLYATKDYIFHCSLNIMVGKEILTVV